MGFQTIRHRTSAHGHPPGDRPCAFTVIELLAVITILLIMMALIAPAVGNMTSTAGRKGAVNVLMNTFEQARVAALETGANVYVILWRRAFPERDSLMVVRERPDWEPAPTPPAAATDIIPLSKWIKLPKGVLFAYKNGSIKDTLTEPNLPVGKLTVSYVGDLPGKPTAKEVSVVGFNASGAVSFPAPNSANLVLFISEGVRDAGGDEANIGTAQTAALFERLAFARYTGRVRLDVTILDDKIETLDKAD